MKRASRRIAAAVAAACLAGCPADDFVPDAMWLQSQAAVVDVDGNGLADIVAVTRYRTTQPMAEQGHVLVWRQTAAGVFAPADDYRVGSVPWGLAVADLDGDGLPELVVAEPRTSTSQTTSGVHVLRNDPASPGKFTARDTIEMSPGYQVAVADLDGDGRPDILTASGYVLYQEHAPSAPGRLRAPYELAAYGGDARYQSTSPVAADLNGDGRTDVALMTSYYEVIDGKRIFYSARVAVAYQLPDGTLTAFAFHLPVTSDELGARYLKSADLDMDGDADLLVDTPAKPPYMSALLQGESGRLGAPLPVDFWPVGDWSFADLNADGRVDVGSVRAYPYYDDYDPTDMPRGVKYEILLWFQNPSAPAPAFGRVPQVLDAPPGTGVVAFGDIDGNGFTDMALIGDTVDGAPAIRAWVRMQNSAVPGTFGEAVMLP